MVLALDHSVTANASSGATLALPGLTTTNTNVVAVVFVLLNGSAAAVTVSSITDTAGLTWTLRTRLSAAGGDAKQSVEEWWATSASALSSNVITLNLAGTMVFATASAFGISGADTTTPFDVNGSLPSSSATNNSTSVTLSTTAANTMVLGCFREGSAGSPTAGTGYTQILGANFMLTEYQIFTSAQTSLAVTQTTGSGTSNGIVADAVQQASAVAAPIPYQPWYQRASILAQ